MDLGKIIFGIISTLALIISLINFLKLQKHSGFFEAIFKGLHFKIDKDEK